MSGEARTPTVRRSRAGRGSRAAHALVALLALALASAPLAAEPAARPDASLFHLEASWTTARGAKVTLASLGGQPLVLAMVYLGCQASCPLVVSDLKAVEARLSAAQRAQVRFVLVSFDPARDTPARLAAYAETRHLDLSRWTLLTGDDDGVRDLAAATGLKFRPTGTGDFVHSNVISVVDARGVVTHQQLGMSQDPAETVAALEALLTVGKR